VEGMLTGLSAFLLLNSVLTENWIRVTVECAFSPWASAPAPTDKTFREKPPLAEVVRSADTATSNATSFGALYACVPVPNGDVIRAVGWASEIPSIIAL